MVQYIQSVLGCNVQKIPYKLPPQTPQYLKNDYKYQKYVIEGQECLFVLPLDFSFTAYKKQYQKLKQLTNLPIVLQLKGITQYQRSTLIEERIPFVVEGTQIYLPFLAICLTEKYREVTEIETFTPTTQLVFLYLFYNKVKLSASDLARKINSTPMSVSRAYKALTDCGLFSAESDGVKKYIVPNTEGGELLRSAEPFLIDPVEKTLYVQKNVDLGEYVASGIYALSKKTMLSAAENERCCAVSRKTHFDASDCVSKEQYELGEAIAVEKWFYDPAALAEDNIVDDISLILSLKDDGDERVQMEIEELRSKYKW